jgi:hypothetical protein
METGMQRSTRAKGRKQVNLSRLLRMLGVVGMVAAFVSPSTSYGV